MICSARVSMRATPIWAITSSRGSPVRSARRRPRGRRERGRHSSLNQRYTASCAKQLDRPGVVVAGLRDPLLAQTRCACDRAVRRSRARTYNRSARSGPGASRQELVGDRRLVAGPRVPQQPPRRRSRRRRGRAASAVSAPRRVRPAPPRRSPRRVQLRGRRRRRARRPPRLGLGDRQREVPRALLDVGDDVREPAVGVAPAATVRRARSTEDASSGWAKRSRRASTITVTGRPERRARGVGSPWAAQTRASVGRASAAASSSTSGRPGGERRRCGRRAGHARLSGTPCRRALAAELQREERVAAGHLVHPRRAEVGLARGRAVADQVVDAPIPIGSSGRTRAPVELPGPDPAAVPRTSPRGRRAPSSRRSARAGRRRGGIEPLQIVQCDEDGCVMREARSTSSSASLRSHAAPRRAIRVGRAAAPSSSAARLGAASSPGASSNTGAIKSVSPANAKPASA